MNASHASQLACLGNDPDVAVACPTQWQRRSHVAATGAGRQPPAHVRSDYVLLFLVIIGILGAHRSERKKAPPLSLVAVDTSLLG